MKRIFTFLLLVNFLTIVNSQNNSLDFDDTDDYVTMGDVLDLGTSDFTIEAWIFVEGTATSNKIINKGGTSVGSPSNAGYSLLTSFFSGNNIDFAIGHSNGSIIRAETNGLIQNTWQHIAGVREGTNIRLYIDGVNAANNTTPVIFDVDTNIPFAIGAAHRGVFGNTTDFMKGKIDEVRIWNIARTQLAIQSTMNIELLGNESGLIAYYNFNQGIAGGNNLGVTTLMDNTSNGNNGTLNNFALNGNNSNWVGSTVPLPVELVDFNGKLISKQIKLEWTTATELNNTGFDIQKSIDGIAWEKLDFVKGQGTSGDPSEYQYLDINPYRSVNYYRLKQIDFDGQFEYSKVIEVVYEPAEGNIRVYPNPSSGTVNIQLDNPRNQRTKITIIDQLGRKVWQRESMKGESNWNQELQLEGIGMYFITAWIGKKAYYEPVIVLGE